jgi:hypothetical protein
VVGFLGHTRYGRRNRVRIQRRLRHRVGFASTLDVSVGDLNLDLRDYLLLTGLTGVMWSLLIAAAASLYWWTEGSSFTSFWQKVAGVAVLFAWAALTFLVPIVVIVQTVATGITDDLDTVFMFGTYFIFVVGILSSVRLLRGDSSENSTDHCHRAGDPLGYSERVARGHRFGDRR